MCLRSDSASEEIFQRNVQACDREWGVATPPHSLQTQLVLGCCLEGLEVGKVPEKGSVAFWKEGPSVVHWGMMKSVHLLDSGRVWSLGYPFSQQNILISHCCLWKVSATEVLIRDSHLRHRPLSPSNSCPSHEFRFHYTPLPSFHAPNTYISFPKCLESSLTFLHSPLLNLKLGFQDIFKYFFFPE